MLAKIASKRLPKVKPPVMEVTEPEIPPIKKLENSPSTISSILNEVVRTNVENKVNNANFNYIYKITKKMKTGLLVN